MYYFLPDPPYFLMGASLLAGLASGAAFSETLKQGVQAWSKQRSTSSLNDVQGRELLISFLGICISICVFLSSGLGIFGFPPKLAYAVSVPMTILISWLVWYQLGKILSQLERGGSKALDLDSWG